MIMVHHVLCIIFICGASSYKWSSSLLNFDEAISYCKAQFNSTLATISNAQQDLIVAKLCSSHGITNCWIGSHYDINVERNEDNCLETKRNAYTINENMYGADVKGILCHQLRHPICSDPPISDISDLAASHIPHIPIYKSNYNRKLLQTSCHEVQPQTNNDTCVIYASGDQGNPKIECNPNYPKCEIHFYEFGSSSDGYSNLHCPQNECISCDIHINNTWAAQLKIHGNECGVVSLRVMSPDGASVRGGPYGLHYSVIYAPSAGGTLKIDGGVLYNNEILSTLGTANIIIDLDHDHSSSNIIDGEHVSGYLNVSCIDHATCQGEEIVCGSSDTECNIRCLGVGDAIVSSACYSVNVYAEGGTSDVHWLCDDAQPSACLQSTLQCYNSSDDISSGWMWDYANKCCSKINSKKESSAMELELIS
eukprot:870806_1